MRTDVKVGIALGAIVLVIAVSYYGTTDRGEIELADSTRKIEEHNNQVLDQILSPSAPASSSQPPPVTAPRTATPTAEQPSNTARERGPTRTRVDRNRRERTSEEDSDSAQSAPGLFPRPERSPARPEATPRPEAITVAVPARPAAEPVEAAELQDPLKLKLPGTPDPRPSAPVVRPSSAADRTSTGRSRSESANTGQRHQIQAGDSFALLAEHYYGSQRHASFLAQSNPDVDPYRMKIGSVIRIPPLASEPAFVAGLTPVARKPSAGGYEVQSGDTFYHIAESKLGSGMRWREIYELNRQLVGDDPNLLKVGQVLKLPAG